MLMTGRGYKKSRPLASSLDGYALRLIAATDRFLRAELSFGRALACFAGFLVVALIVALSAGGTYLSTNFLDYLFMVEQGWRLAQGQLPYRDFISPLGPLYYLIVGSVEYLSGADPAAYRLNGFLAMTLFGPGLVWISWRRLPGKVAVFVAIAFAMIPLTPRNIDGMFFDFDFLAIYNSLCWPLAATVILGTLFESKPGNCRRLTLADGLAIGLALIGLLTLKLPHGVIASGVLAIGLIIRPANRLCLAAAALLTFAAIALLYLSAAPLPHLYLQQLIAVGHANDLSARVHSKLQIYVYSQMVTLLLALFAIWMIEKYRQFHPVRIGYRDVAAAGAILLASYGEAINDHGDTPAALPLLFLLLWQVALRANLPIEGKSGSRYRQIKACLLAVPFLLWLGLPLANDSLALIFHSISFRLRPSTAWLAALPDQKHLVRHLRLPGNLSAAGSNVQDDADLTDQWGVYLQALEEGVKELQTLKLDHAKIYEARFNSALPWLLQAPSPRGVLAWLDMDRTFSLASHPPADSYLSDVDVLMVSKLAYDRPWTRYFSAIYGVVIERDFIRVSDTTYWQIYKRRS